MPETKSPCDPSQLTSIVEHALREAKVSATATQHVLDEVGAMQRIEGYVTYAKTNFSSAPPITNFEVVQNPDAEKPYKWARFYCPPNPPDAEAELKRAHTNRIRIIAYYKLLPDGNGSLFELMLYQEPVDWTK